MLFALVAAGPLTAQRAADSAVYIGLLVAPNGAFPAPTSGTVAGATVAGIALSALYGYARDRPTPGASANSAGARLDLRLPGGVINLSAIGGRRFASCPPNPPAAGRALLEVECHDLWMAGANVTARLVRADITDGFSTGCLTVSLDAQGGIANDARRTLPSIGAAEVSARAAGFTAALVSPGDAVTGALSLTPALAWARVDTRQIIPRVGAGAAARADTVPLEHEGQRFMLSAGFALLTTRSRAGIHMTAQKVFIHGGDIVVGAAISVASPWGRRPPSDIRRERMEELERMIRYRTAWARPTACDRLAGR
jgi:hypothetical protein